MSSLLATWISGLLLLPSLVFAAGGGAVPAKLPLLGPSFGEHMVLQRDQANPLWGWAAPGETVRVTLAGRTVEARAAADGRWQADVAVPPAGGPYELVVEAPRATTLSLHDVLVGDVWLCGGQSNMEFTLRRAKTGPADATAGEHPRLRFFTVGNHAAYAPTDMLRGEWSTCTPESSLNVSAVAWYFATAVQRDVDVPIGLIVSAAGGSPVEAWISPGNLAPTGLFESQVAEIHRLHEKGAPELGSFLMHWLDEYDAGGRDTAWAREGFDDSAWKSVELPTGAFADLGVPDTPAVAWFRRTVTLPDPLPEGRATLHLGVVEKMDTTYVNGRWVGASSWVENPRAYLVPEGLLHPGENLIAIRDFKVRANGGFLTPAADICIMWPDGTSVPLAGTWRGAVSVDARPPHAMPLDWENYPTMPTVFHSGMIAPLAPRALAGALWYQGEANTSHASQYRTLLTALIGDWRETFARPDLPFYLVQLPAFMGRRDTPGTDGWTELREAQAATVASVPHTALAVSLDTGEAGNIHPTDKQPVGDRLAACALALHYGRKVPYQGPSVASVEPVPGALRLRFDHAGTGLVLRDIDGADRTFQVAGDDHVWRWAQARVESATTLVLASPEVSKPVAARYAWQSNPPATLFNSDGFPAGTFRTDGEE